jgi:hypothetical protein
MKLNGMLANWLGLAVLVLCCQMGAADEKKSEKLAAPVHESVPPPPPPRTCPQPPPPGPSGPQWGDKQLDAKAAEMMGALFGLMTETMRSNAQVDQNQVQELIEILNETKSPYTLVATTAALAPLGDKAKVAVPAILRNAERLKILESLGNPDSKKGGLANMLMESIYAIQTGGDGSVFQMRGPQRALTPMPPPGMPCPAPFYAPAPVCPSAPCPPPVQPVQPRSY